LVLSEALKKFLKYQTINCSTIKTIRHYSTHIQYFINFTKDIEINDLTYEIYEDYIVFLKKKYKESQVFKGQKIPLSSRTIKTYVSALKTFLKYCYSHNLLNNDIGDLIKMPKYQKKVIHVLNDVQIQEILSYYDTSTYLGCRNLFAISLMLDCGLRVSEVSSLTFSDFDIVNRCILVNGKGQKQRYVPFTDFVLKVYNKLVNFNDFKYPFCDVLGNRLQVSGVTQIVKRLKKSLGYTTLNPHLFRHTFATLYLLNGGDPISLQTILGHTTLYMTEVYVHIAQQIAIARNVKYTPLSNIPFFQNRKINFFPPVLLLPIGSS